MAHPNTLLVLTTCGGSDEADALAAALVEARVAACVNVVDRVTSTYRWQDTVKRDQEALLVIKTTEDRYEALEKLIRERHSYELPELLAVRVGTGLPEYLQWIAASVEE